MSNLREGWNFHGDVATELESIAKSMFNLDIESCCHSIFSADAIEIGHFIEVMIIMLRKNSEYKDNEKIDEFVCKCSEYFGKSGNEIDKNIANELFEEFENLLCR